MLWTPDPIRDEARKLPDWVDFHRSCGEAGLCFDILPRDKNRGPFHVVAFHPVKTDMGGWQALELCRTRDHDLIAALKRVHHESGRGTATTTAMIDRGLTGKTVEPDDFEGMFG